jgi:predicted nucleotidyltransferase
MVVRRLTMTREEVIAVLRAHEAELKAAGIVHLHLHGSVARDDSGPDSDVDLAGRFDRGKRLSLIDMVGLQNRLSDILGTEADLCDAERLKEAVRENFDREAELVF